LMAVVVFPTPPFWFAIAITMATWVSPRSECSVSRRFDSDGPERRSGV
jgi:hypothetical protein